ncbi:hypothetical protein DPEC_G00263620, partial [Dallia pectoralis]
VHANSGEGEHGHIDGHRLDEVHQGTHGGSEHPAAGVKGVGQGERDTRDTHQQVGEGQVTDEQVGDVVHFARVPDDVKQQIVARHAHQQHQGVAGDDEQFEGRQKLHAHKLGAGFGSGGVVQRHFKHVPADVPLCAGYTRPGTSLVCSQTRELHPNRRTPC